MTTLVNEYYKASDDIKNIFILKLRELYPIIYVVNVKTTTNYGTTPDKPIGCFSDESAAKQMIGDGYREFYSYPDGGEQSTFTITPTATKTIDDFSLLIKIDTPIDMTYYGMLDKL